MSRNNRKHPVHEVSKAEILSRLVAAGHARIKGISQCVSMMHDGTNTYGVIILAKTEPGFMNNEKRLNHSVDQRHLDALGNDVAYTQLWILEANTNKVLMGYTHEFEWTQRAIHGTTVLSIPRDQFTDVTEFAKGLAPLADIPGYHPQAA